MGPKKKKEKPPPDPNALTEVDKTFYEIQIEGLNQKIARLQTHCDELEVENEKLEKSLYTLDVDRADIISHLKRTLESKKEEIVELNERITALEQAKETEKNLFIEKIKNMELEFKQMHEHHTSEIKLLNGKLNSLEEFRAQREDLLNKFVAQEKFMAQQKEAHKEELLKVERELAIFKSRLRKQVEEKLLNLSLDFQKVTQSRIASTTQRLIRENITINNELNILVKAWKSLYEENENLRTGLTTVKRENSIEKYERDRTMKRNVIQSQVIDRLCYEHHKLYSKYSEFNQLLKRINELTRRLDESETEKDDQKIRVMILLKKLHSEQVQSNLNKTDRIIAETHCKQLELTVFRALKIVKELIGLRKSILSHVKETDEEEGAWCARQKALRTALLKNLLELLDNNELFTDPSLTDILQSTTTLTESQWADYKLGDIGIIPKVDSAEVRKVIGGLTDESYDD